MATPTSELSRARERLDPGAFAFVMATGIVSVAASLDSLPLLSDALLALACLGWVAIALALAPRALGELAHALPRSYAFVAATAVLGTRLTMLGWPWAALALGALAAAAWLVLLGRGRSRRRPDGSWFLLVVGTQALAVLAAGLAPRWNGDLLWAALGWWLVGLCLYPFVAAVVGAELRSRPRFGPDLWITMGALAISTLAGAELLVAARELDSLVRLRGAVRVADLTTWALATAWILPLVAGELRNRAVVRDLSERWSFVFPLGMYAVANQTLSGAIPLAALATVGRVFTAIALVAWAVTALGVGAELIRSSHTAAAAFLRDS